MLSVVLIEPEIPPNTGSVGRLCLATDHGSANFWKESIDKECRPDDVAVDRMRRAGRRDESAAVIAGNDIPRERAAGHMPCAAGDGDAVTFVRDGKAVGRREPDCVPIDARCARTDPDATLAWCKPSIAHIRWDSSPLVRRIVRSAANVSKGRKDVKQNFVPAEFVPGGTVGPAPQSASHS